MINYDALNGGQRIELFRKILRDGPQTISCINDDALIEVEIGPSTAQVVVETYDAMLDIDNRRDLMARPLVIMVSTVWKMKNLHTDLTKVKHKLEGE